MCRKSGKICIVEGLWCAGKSTVCKFLSAHGYHYINEPNCIKEGVSLPGTKERTMWYVQRHFQNLKQASKLAGESKDVVIERSPLSSLYFIDKYCSEKPGGCFENFKNLLKKTTQTPWVVYLKPKNIDFVISCMKKRDEIASLADNNTLNEIDRILSYSLKKLQQGSLVNLTKINVSGCPISKFKKIYENTKNES